MLWHCQQTGASGAPRWIRSAVVVVVVVCRGLTWQSRTSPLPMHGRRATGRVVLRRYGVTVVAIAAHRPRLAGSRRVRGAHRRRRSRAAGRRVRAFGPLQELGLVAVLARALRDGSPLLPPAVFACGVLYAKSTWQSVHSSFACAELCKNERVHVHAHSLPADDPDEVLVAVAHQASGCPGASDGPVQLVRGVVPLDPGATGVVNTPFVSRRAERTLAPPNRTGVLGRRRRLRRCLRKRGMRCVDRHFRILERRECRTRQRREPLRARGLRVCSGRTCGTLSRSSALRRVQSHPRAGDSSWPCSRS